MLSSRRDTLALLGGAAVLASGCASDAERQSLTLFDAVWRCVRENYYDADAVGRSWLEARRTWRPRAKEAKTRAELYLNVLMPMLERLNASHVRLIPASPLPLPPNTSVRLPNLRRGDRPPLLTDADETGMGAELTWDGDAIIASRIETGGIAEIAGLQPGDAVSLSGYRGAPNGGRLDLVRRTSDQKIVLEWERKPPTLARRYRPFADRSAYVRFDAFDQLSVDWLLDRLQTPHERIILDLRSNRGGQLIQCHRVLSAFLPVTTDLGAFRTRKGDRPMRASPAPPIMASTVIVLTSARTMSSAEILCENLKTLRRAVLIGDRTAGAVLAAQTYRLPDESELMLPYGDYLAPSGQSLEGLGVAPTIEAARLDEASLMRRAEGLASSI